MAPGVISLEINRERGIAVQAIEAPSMRKVLTTMSWILPGRRALVPTHGCLGRGIGAKKLAPFARHCNVLLALAGENLTLTLEELDPSWTFPMHYNERPIAAGMTKLASSLNGHSLGPVILVRHHTITFPLPKLSSHRPTMVVLEPAVHEAPEKA